MTALDERPAEQPRQRDAAELRGRVVRTRWWSLRVAPRALLVVVALVAATAVIGVWSVSIGDFPIALGDVVEHAGAGQYGEVESDESPETSVGLEHGARVVHDQDQRANLF